MKLSEIKRLINLISEDAYWKGYYQGAMGDPWVHSINEGTTMERKEELIDALEQEFGLFEREEL